MLPLYSNSAVLIRLVSEVFESPCLKDGDKCGENTSNLIQEFNFSVISKLLPTSDLEKKKKKRKPFYSFVTSKHADIYIILEHKWQQKKMREAGPGSSLLRSWPQVWQHRHGNAAIKALPLVSLSPVHSAAQEVASPQPPFPCFAPGGPPHPYMAHF